MKRPILAIGLALLSSVSLSQGQTLIADAAADYLTAPGYTETTAPTEAPEGWSYWLSNESVDGAEEALVAERPTVGNSGNTGFGNMLNERFKTPIVLGSVTDGEEFEIFSDGQINGAVVGEDLLVHPGSRNDSNDYVIVRYTFSAGDLASGSDVMISGSFRELVEPGNGTINANNGGSVDVFVYHNSTELFKFESIDGADGDSTLQESNGTFDLTATIAVGDAVSFVVGNNDNYSADETALKATISAGSGSGAQPFLLLIEEAPNGTDLILTWNSREGGEGGEYSYNVRSSTDLGSDPVTRVIVDGAAGLGATPPLNTFTLPRPTDPATFYIVEEFLD